jgi:hypothetical protein
LQAHRSHGGNRLSSPTFAAADFLRRKVLYRPAIIAKID